MNPASRIWTGGLMTAADTATPSMLAPSMLNTFLRSGFEMVLVGMGAVTATCLTGLAAVVVID